MSIDSYEDLLKEYELLNIEPEFNLFINGLKENINNYEYFSNKLWFVKATDEYIAILKMDEMFGVNELKFVFSDKNHSNYKCLFSYILDFLTSDNKCFYKIINNIIIYDYHAEILEIRDLTLNNAIVDKKILKILSERFKNLKNVLFIKCKVLKECEFNILNCDILDFINCEIENVNSFNYCNQNLYFENSSIIKIVNSIINSVEIKINVMDDRTLEKLFLLCHFPNLKSIMLGEDGEMFNPSYYSKCLLFLPYATPNLETLFIEGEIFSFDFLYHCRNLKECEIYSVDDSVGWLMIHHPYIANEEERNKIIENSNRNINSDIDIHLAIFDKMNSILEMLKIIGFSQEELQIYLNKKLPTIILNPIEEISSKPAERIHIYDSYHKILKLYTHDDYKERFIINDKFYEINKTFIGKRMRIKRNGNGIIINKSFVYHPSGIPIIFEKNEYNHQKQIDAAIELKQLFITDEINDELIDENQELILKKTIN